ncbi:MAG: possible membrane protein [uncultured Nocardioidaceae bacterium]|uniref:Possible membrane protein n=1 Tax=uncultured Nocardioidaceae bacterium TaxID=253824 RepID=A0A6J4KVU1_9ACTN|nr:MAG: possible membrane protein [uncultured Nocardioidaceae bacterium]
MRAAAGATARGARLAGGATARGVRRSGSATGRGATYVVRQAQRAGHAEGAGDSGLSRLLELHAFNAAGDAAVAISLAGTLFFQVPTDQARGQVALFLGLTMLPFAVVAPLVGPVLDRFGHGRRWAVGATMAVRAFLCWVLAGAVAGDSAGLFPAALGVLVASKAYGVTRAAAVPRVAPESLGLVGTNSRISLAGITGAAVSAPLALLASLAGSQWSLRYAFAVFVVATVLAVLLPARVDSSHGEQTAQLGGETSARVPAVVVRALRCNAGLRLLSGFLTLYMAFLLRAEPFPAFEGREALLLGLVIGAAGLGNTIGIALGTLLRSLRAESVVVVALVAAATAAVVAAVLYSLPVVVLLGLTAGVAQSLGKLSLDALIQERVPDRTRSSAFARSETLLQLSWVAGGFLGIALPLVPVVGLGVAAAVLVTLAAWVVSGVRREGGLGLSA